MAHYVPPADQVAIPADTRYSPSAPGRNMDPPHHLAQFVDLTLLARLGDCRSMSADSTGWVFGMGQAVIAE